MPLTPAQQRRLQQTPANLRVAKRNKYLAQNSAGNTNTNNNRSQVNRQQSRTSYATTPRVSNFNASMLNPRNFQIKTSSPANTARIQHLTSGIITPLANRQNTQFFAMRPARQGLTGMTTMFAEFRYINLRYRFVGLQPSTSSTQVYIGYTPSALTIPNVATNLSPFKGFWFGQSSTTSPWQTIITPSDSMPYFLANNAGSAGATALNSQGWIHYIASGGTAETTLHGNLEIQGLVEFRAPLASI